MRICVCARHTHTCTCARAPRKCLLQVGHESGESPRQPPLHPDVFEAHLASKHFTSDKADRPLVSWLYRITVSSVLGGSQILRYGLSRWGPHEFVTLGSVLPLCTQLQQLRLSNNAGGDTMVQVLLAAAREHGALQSLSELDIHNNGVTDDGIAALSAALSDPQVMPQLTQLGSVGNKASEASLDALDDVCARRMVLLDRWRPII
uniref:Uncharacterized protein n=1 Tax=Haptolina brevifila TaxID=156173 RepID=A0A7S2GBM4_9EUKA|mmetsp:Transcript_32820/g.65326  ORF Transcript_32820/g.65326 Transcript_32820/m.65326 type:complete len:205 (+) Transcript_32820:901-1515(+)